MAEPRGHGSAGESPRRAGHETAEINARAVVLFLVGLAAVLGLVHVSLTALFGGYAARETRRDAALPADRPAAAPLVPEPLLQVEPRLDLIRMRAQEESLLTSTAWTDRAAGRVRIPIDRAIEILAARGLPARAAAPADLPPRDWTSGRVPGSTP